MVSWNFFLIAHACNLVTNVQSQHFNIDEERTQDIVCDQSDDTVDCVVDCIVSYSCSLLTIYGGAGDTVVNCDNYGACYKTTIIGAAGDTSVMCSGSYACYHASINGGEEGTFVNCTNKRSCAYAVIIGATGDTSVMCSGSYACYNASINGGEEDTFVNCTNRSSCAYAVITGGGGNTFVNSNILMSAEFAVINGGGGDTQVNCIVGTCLGTYCYEMWACINATITGGGGDTSVRCDGMVTCDDATIYGGIGDMFVDCEGGIGACRGTTLNSGQGDMVITAKGTFRGLEATTINCLAPKYCNITAYGSELALRDSIIRADFKDGTKLFVNLVGPNVYGLARTQIYCPMDHKTGSEYTNDSFCNIHAEGESVLDDTSIYAVEAFNNVYIECNTDDLIGKDCYENNHPTLYCTSEFNASCALEPSSDGNHMDFLDPDCLCADYVLPSPPPTAFPSVQPTTALPTFSPTKYDPEGDSPRTLYISTNGCDVGVCDTDAFDWSGHCYYDWFNALDGFDECCSNVNAIPPAPSAVCSVPFSFLINGTGTSSNHFYSDIYENYRPSEGIYGNNEGEWVLETCFKAADPFVCYHPTVTLIRYEEIDYENEDQYLNLAYKNMSNLVNVPFCKSGTSRECGIWDTCPIDNGLLDIAWTSEGRYVLYWINGPGVRPRCGNYLSAISINVVLQLECSAFLRSSTCSTFTYTWSCLRGEGECAENDGHGTIKMDIGQYTFSETIRTADKQIRIVGQGEIKTTLTHDTPDQSLIDCYFKQCYITIANLSYNLTSTNVIQATNRGHIKFENIRFISNDDTTKVTFVFDDASQVLFSNCVFARQIITWNITNEASVSITQSTFKNINTNDGYDANSIFNIENAVLSISKSVFEDNNEFYSIINSGYESTVTIVDSVFTDNRNNAYIWYSVGSNASMINTVHDATNECTSTHCFVFFESDLWIDPLSSSNTTVVLGHSPIALNSNIVYALDFTPTSILRHIHFQSFGVNDDHIIFEPCVPFDPEHVIRTDFDDIASLLSATDTFNQTLAFYQDTLRCARDSLCYIECVWEPLACFRSHFIANASTKAIFKCSTSSSCNGNIMDINGVEVASILCDESFACKEMTVHVHNTDSFYLECIQTDSCAEAQIFVENTANVLIKCYGIQSCNGLRIWSDTNDIQITLYSFNKDIIIAVPSEFIKDNLYCNQDDSYLTLDGATYNNLEASLHDLFGGGLPCQEVTYHFDAEDKTDCQILYDLFSDNVRQEEIRALVNGTYDMQCYSDIYVKDITEYACIGTWSPTMDPTQVPTFDPTPQPTRHPTVSGAYDSFFHILYRIGHLSDTQIYFLIENKETAFAEIIDIIEMAYFEETSLKLEYFWLRIETINGLKLQDIDGDSIPKLLATKDNDDALAMNCTMECGKTTCEILLSYKPEVIANAQLGLQAYFNHMDPDSSSNITLDTATEEEEIYSKEQEEEVSPWLNPLLITLFVFLFIMCVVAVLALLHNKNKLCLPVSKTVDDSIWYCSMAYGLQVFDFVSDINLGIEMFTHQSFATDATIRGVAWSSACFIIIPYVVNITMAARIKEFVRRNPLARIYFEESSTLFVLLVCMSGGCHVSLTVVSSAIFGFNKLNSGLLRYELRELIKLKMIGTVIIENAPQCVIQVIYAMALGSISHNTYLSFIALLTYFIQAKNTQDITPKLYYVEVTTASSTAQPQPVESIHPLKSEHKKIFSRNKGRTQALALQLCEVFGLNRKAIEISKHCVFLSDGIRFHAVQYVHGQKEHPSVLFEEKKDEIAQIVSAHFENLSVSVKMVMDEQDMGALDSHKQLNAYLQSRFTSEHAQQISEFIESVTQQQTQDRAGVVLEDRENNKASDVTEPEHDTNR